MSGASREGYDLTTKIGWQHLKKNGYTNLLWRDTFAQFVCKIVGHNIYDSDYGSGTPDYACKRCCKFIKMEKKNEG